MQLTKIHRCRSCNYESKFTITTDLNLEEVTVSARCPKCNAQVYLTFSSLLSSKDREEESTVLDENLVNEVDQLSSNAIKDIMDEEL